MAGFGWEHAIPHSDPTRKSRHTAEFRDAVVRFVTLRRTTNEGFYSAIS